MPRRRSERSRSWRPEISAGGTPPSRARCRPRSAETGSAKPFVAGSPPSSRRSRARASKGRYLRPTRCQAPPRFPSLRRAESRPPMRASTRRLRCLSRPRRMTDCCSVGLPSCDRICWRRRSRSPRRSTTSRKPATSPMHCPKPSLVPAVGRALVAVSGSDPVLGCDVDCIASRCDDAIAAMWSSCAQAAARVLRQPRHLGEQRGGDRR